MAQYRISTADASLDFEIRDDIGRLLQNARNLLRLRTGELPFDRKRGLDTGLYDVTITEANEMILPEVDRLLGWEPRVRAMSAEVYRTEDGETVVEAVAEI